MTKQSIRQEIKVLCSQHAEEFTEKSADICQKIISSLVYKEAEVVLGYMALKDEVNLGLLILDALKKGKKTAVPKIMDFEKGVMKFFYLDKEQTLGTQTESGTLGIKEPDEKKLLPVEPDTIKNKKTLILVPGRAFTLSGDRLGRGKGFYDSFLNELKGKNNITLAGVCFDFQIKKSLPVDDRDIKMDRIFTLQV